MCILQEKDVWWTAKHTTVVVIPTTAIQAPDSRVSCRTHISPINLSLFDGAIQWAPASDPEPGTGSLWASLSLCSTLSDKSTSLQGHSNLFPDTNFLKTNRSSWCVWNLRFPASFGQYWQLCWTFDVQGPGTDSLLSWGSLGSIYKTN